MVTTSVLINNYNYGSFVSRAIDSALSQNTDDFEVVVVDDGSTDQSRCVLAAYADRVTAVYQENRGQAAAMNAAVRASRGEFLCFLDADDWWTADKLAATAAAFRSDPEVVLVYHRLQPVLDGASCSSLKPIPRTLCSGDLSSRLARSAGWWPFPMTSAIAVRRSAWEAAGDIPESFRISADAWLAGIYPFLGRVAAVPDTLGFYRIHGNNSWYRPNDDPDILRKRINHWQATVEATNSFLASRHFPIRLGLKDHYPHRLAVAMLDGADWRTHLNLALRGMVFVGEPNLPRRLWNVARSTIHLSRLGREMALGEELR